VSSIKPSLTGACVSGSAIMGEPEDVCSGGGGDAAAGAAAAIDARAPPSGSSAAGATLTSIASSMRGWDGSVITGRHCSLASVRVGVECAFELVHEGDHDVARRLLPFGAGE